MALGTFVTGSLVQEIFQGTVGNSVTGNLDTTGNLTVGGTLEVTGVSTFDAGVVFVSGATTSGGNFDLSGSTGTFKSCTGLNTLGGKVAVKVIATPVAAASAAALGSANILTISSDSAAKSVKLVAGVAGDIVVVLNTTATAAEILPATGGTINGLTANAAVIIPASTGTLLVCTATNTWSAFDLPARSTAA